MDLDTVSGSEPIDHRNGLLTKVAKLYFEAGLRQPDIAERLNLSQSRVSRLLQQASDVGIVRTVVVSPPGVYADLEGSLVERFSLVDAVVVASADESDSALLAALGSAGALYLESTLSGSEKVGLSSWSSSLLAVAHAMSPRKTGPMAEEVVQVIGGVGQPEAQIQANILTGQFAQVTGAIPRYFPAPGIVGHSDTRDALMADPYLADIISHWEGLSTLLVGIGTLDPSPLLASSGNAVSQRDADSLREAGAVGDVCLRFFDRSGTFIDTEVDKRVLGLDVGSLLAVPRRIGVAGGKRKLEAIRGAISGGWVNLLITDRETALSL